MSSSALVGGFTAPLVCARRPVDLLVLVAAMVPLPGERAIDYWEVTGYDDAGSGDPADPDTFFHDVPPTLAEGALGRDVARRVVRERLGVEPDELDGGHCPFLSRPRELVDRLEAYVGLSGVARKGR